ncbi:MAG: hypothetical protein ACTSYD_02085 [Candidatus Heimdallarchaeaceae archaeon]
MAREKSGIDMTMIVVIGAILVLAGVIQLPGLQPTPTGEIPETKPVETVEQVETVDTGVQTEVIRTINVSSVTFKPRVADVFAPGAPVDVECVIQEDGTTIYDSDNIASENATLEPGSTYLLACWDDGQTTDLSGNSISLDSSNDWYGYMTYITMPIKSEATFPSKDFKTGGKVPFVGMYKEASPASSYVKNPNGEINSTTQADLSADDIKNFKFVIQAADNAAFGDPYAANDGKYLQFACDYNLDGFDDMKGVSAEYDGVTYRMVESTDKPDYNQSVFDVIYDIEGLSGIVDNKELTITWTVDVSNLEPTDSGCNFTCYLIDPALYYDSTEGHGFKYDTDDSEDNADIGIANYPITVNCQ